MTIALIVATAGVKQVIGDKGDLPWNFSADLKFFKAKTLNHTVVMGRVTYQSIVARLGKPLPNRNNIVLTRDQNFTDDRVQIFYDTTTLIANLPSDETLFVIGGASIYREFMPHADLIYLTHIDAEITGDTYFPLLSPAEWQGHLDATIEENGTKLRFCTYHRLPTQ